MPMNYPDSIHHQYGTFNLTHRDHNEQICPSASISEWRDERCRPLDGIPADVCLLFHFIRLFPFRFFLARLFWFSLVLPHLWPTHSQMLHACKTSFPLTSSSLWVQSPSAASIRPGPRVSLTPEHTPQLPPMTSRSH